MSGRPLIAVVDDELHTRETVADYLALHDLDVVALDGGAALRVEIEHRVPDLVVLDLHMPGENGLSVLRFLRPCHFFQKAKKPACRTIARPINKLGQCIAGYPLMAIARIPTVAAIFRNSPTKKFAA